MPAPPCLLALKVIPNAPRNAVVGWLGDALKVKVHAPALEGRANDELCAFLADQLRLPRRAVIVARGGKSRQKLIQIAGLSLTEVRTRLGVQARPVSSGNDCAGAGMNSRLSSATRPSVPPHDLDPISRSAI